MSPSPRGSSTTAAGRPFRVLVVGTLDLCRSLAAERLLRARLGASGAVDVTSAGTLPALGQDVPAPMTELLGAEGLSAEGHVPRPLDRAAVERADLVLTTTRDERFAVVTEVPAAVRRTFTLRELARIGSTLEPTDLPDGELAARLGAFVDAAALHRRPATPGPATADDVLDPYGLDEDGYLESFEQVRAAVDAIARVALPPDVAPDGAVEVPAPPQPAVRRRRSRARTVALAVVAGMVVVVATATAGALVVMDRLDDRIARFPDPFADLPSRPPAPVPADPGSPDEVPLTVLVLGSSDDAGGGGGDWDAAAELMDVVLLARVTADRGAVQMVAMPPDLAVDVPGGSRGTLRSALSAGGPALAVQTVEQLTAVRVDHVALIDSATFDRVTEALGGVDVDVPSAVVLDGEVVVPEGRQHLTGEQARLWVHADDDAHATDGLVRERAWLGAILARLGADDVRRDPGAWLTLLGVVTDSVAVDEGLDRDRLAGLLTGLRGLRPGDVEVVVAPTALAPSGSDDAVELVPDPAPFEALMAALRADTLGEHLAAAAHRQGAAGD